MKWREIGPNLRELWHRPAGPMNWKNPIRVFAILGWLVVQVFVLLGWAGWRVFQGLMLLGWAVFRGGQFVLGLPPLLLFFFAGLWYAVWSFVRRPFPSFAEAPILALVQYHTPDVFTTMLVWYYLSPLVAVMLCGVISVTVWKVWLEGRRRDFAPFAKLPPWPLSADQETPAIVIGEVHHPIEAREIFSPSWLTIPERGLYTGVAIFGAVGSGKTSACMNPFARQLLGWQAHNPHMRAAALVLEVKGDFCHDIRQILVEAGRGEDYIEIGMNSHSQWNPLSAWWLDSYSLAYTVSSLLNQLFGKGKEPFWQQAYTNLVRWIIELHRVFPQRWVTLQQVYRCAIEPELFASKIEAAQKLSDDLNTGTIFVESDALVPQLTHLEQWNWTRTPGRQQHQAVHTRPLKAKLEELNITHEIVWQAGPGKDTRERVEAINRWFVHDWQNLDNKIKSSIVEGVSVFLSMFDMPDVARVFCPPAPYTTDDPQAIILQAQIKRLKAEKEAAAAKAAEPQPQPGAEPQPEGEPEAEAAEPVKAAQPEAEPQPEGEQRQRRRSRKATAGDGRQDSQGGGDQIHMGRPAEDAGGGAGAGEGGAAGAGAGNETGRQDHPGGETKTRRAEGSAVDHNGGGAGRQDPSDTRPLNREQPTPYPGRSRDYAPPTADLSVDRAGQGAGLEYARWYQPRPIPRRGRDAQERLVTSASHATGPNEGESGQLLSARRLYL